MKNEGNMCWFFFVLKMEIRHVVRLKVRQRLKW